MFESDLDHKLERLEKELRTLYKRSVPFAVSRGLNATAFEGRSIWQKRVAAEFTLRNKWTTRNMWVDRAKPGNVNTMQARLGSTLPYMAERESGGVETKSGKHGVPIPTSVASGQGRGKVPRTKLVRKAHRMKAIQLRARVAGSRKQKNAASLAMARRQGRGFAFLDTQQGKGIFRVSGARRGRIDLMWDLSRPSVSKKPMPTLEPASASAGKKMPSLMVREMERQIAKQKAFRRGRL